MKRVAILTILLVAGLNGIIRAQGHQVINATINIQAHVIQAIELITINTIAFGELQPAQVEAYVNPVSDLNAGYMIAVGSPNAVFRIEYLPEQRIVQTDGTSYVTFQYEIAGNDKEDQSTSEILRQGNRDITFNSEGRYYFWIGGRLDLKNAQPGSYHADFTIEIDYI